MLNSFSTVGWCKVTTEARGEGFRRGAKNALLSLRPASFACLPSLEAIPLPLHFLRYLFFFFFAFIRRGDFVANEQVAATDIVEKCIPFVSSLMVLLEKQAPMRSLMALS